MTISKYEMLKKRIGQDLDRLIPEKTPWHLKEILKETGWPESAINEVFMERYGELPEFKDLKISSINIHIGGHTWEIDSKSEDFQKITIEEIRALPNMNIDEIKSLIKRFPEKSHDLRRLNKGDIFLRFVSGEEEVIIFYIQTYAKQITSYTESRPLRDSHFRRITLWRIAHGDTIVEVWHMDRTRWLYNHLLDKL